MQSVRCQSCGHEVDSGSLREKYGGACPHCLGAFALEGLVAPPAPTPVPAGGEFGKFVLTDRLGKGGMGEVWKAFDKELNRWVALKFLREEAPQELARFQREARMAAALSHPGIAAIYEVGETNGRHFIAMQYVEGKTLGMYPRQDRKGLARLIRDVARALDYAHGQGVIHRDLKPENIIVERKGEDSRVVILDFGLARPIEGGESVSQTGNVVGTAAYMSPEQTRGDKLDERTDVYSLGATLYEVLTGKPPFEGANIYDIFRKIEDGEPTPPRRLNQHVSHDLETIVLKCLEKNRERRYGNARDFADDLDRFLEGDAIMARRASTWYRLKMRLSKRKAVAATAACAAAVILSLLGWWVFVGSRTSEFDRLYAAAVDLWAPARGVAMVGNDPDSIRQKAVVARLAFEKANEVSERPQAHVRRARCFQMEGREADAVEALERALKLDPDHPEARVEMARTLLFQYQVSRGTATTSRVFRSLQSAGRTEVHEMDEETEAERLLRTRSEKLVEGVIAASDQKDLLSGLFAMGQGKYAAAGEYLSAYAKAESWDTQAHHLEGVCRFYEGNHQLAIAALDRSLRLPDARVLVWRGLAKSYVRLHDEAIRDFKRALELDATSPRARLGLASELALSGKPREAIEEFDKAIGLYPKLAAAFMNRGRIKSSLGLLDEAIEDFTQALAQNPAYAMALVNRAVVQKDLGRFQAAIEDCDAAIRLDKKLASAYNSRGAAKAGLGRFEEAIADYSMAIQLDANYADAYCNRALNHAKLKRQEDAARDLALADKLAPRSPTVLRTGGQIHALAGRHAEALEAFDQSLNIDPKQGDVFAQRGLTKAAMGRFEEAIEDYTRALEMNTRLPIVYLNRGFAKARLNKDEEAIKDYDLAIGRNPRYADAYLNNANAKARLGRFEEALADCRKALEVGGTAWPHADRARGVLKTLESKGGYQAAVKLARDKKYREAIAAYVDFLAKSPRHIASAYNLACCHALLGETAPALDWLEKAIEYGFKDSSHLEKDSDLDSLRKDERYLKLVADLKGK